MSNQKAPLLEITRLDFCVRVKVGPGEGARVLQGLVSKYGFDSWKVLCVVSPKGAPSVVIPAEKRVKELRLLDGKSMEEIETIKLF